MKWQSTLAMVFAVLLSGTAARADITWTGDIDPADPTTWTILTNGSIGVTGDGTLTVDGGSDLFSEDGYLGKEAAASGEVTVDGSGSAWTNNGSLSVGFCGSGSLNITGGGVVSNDSGYLGKEAEASGEVTVDGSGSAWTNDNLYVGYCGSGSLNIKEGGIVGSDNGTIGYGDWMSGGSTGQVTVDGVGSVWNNSSSLDVGEYGDGTLHITAGGVVNSNWGTLGTQDTGTGEVIVDGPGSEWNNSSGLNIGEQGDGTLSITGGAVVTSGTSYSTSTVCYFQYTRGDVTVAGIGSTWSNHGDLVVGRSSRSQGSLSITGGGLVETTGETWVDQYDGTFEVHFDNGTLTTGGLAAAAADLTGTGTINANGLVTDVDLVFDSASALSQSFTLNQFSEQNILVNLDVNGSVTMGAGYGGVGSMAISNGVVINSPRGYLGYKSGASGSATVHGDDSAWTNSGDLYVGREGDGMLSVTGGAAASGAAVYLGYSRGSTGQVTVAGAGSTLTATGGLRVGRDGDGILNITDGASVNSDWCYFASNASGASGQATVDGEGSTWTNNGKLRVGDDGDGTLSVTNGGTLNSPRVALAVGSASNGQVYVDGPGSTVTTTGNFYIGTRGSGTLTITNGGLVTVGGTLYINKDNSGADFLNMSTGGMLALHGAGDASLSEFAGLIDGPNVIHYWDDSIADWAPITGATCGDDYTLEFVTTGELAFCTLLTVGTIPEPQPIPGDLNNDGYVGSRDLDIVRGHWGDAVTPGDLTSGDATGDGLVNSADLDIVRADWGNTAASATVPEPSAIFAALAGVVLLAWRR